MRNAHSVENGATSKKIAQNAVDVLTVVMRNIALMVMYALKINDQMAISHAPIHQNALSAQDRTRQTMRIAH